MKDITAYFDNFLKNFLLPAMENPGNIVPYILIALLLLASFILVVNSRQNTTVKNKRKKKSKNKPIKKPRKAALKQRKTQYSAENRPSPEVIDKITRVDKRIPLNEPMQIQVTISGYKAAREFLFYLPIPPGTKKIGIKKMLYINGKTWARDLSFDDFIIYRDRKTGSVMLNNGQGKWRVWHPLQDIQKKGRIEHDWVMRFRLIMKVNG